MSISSHFPGLLKQTGFKQTDSKSIKALLLLLGVALLFLLFRWGPLSGGGTELSFGDEVEEESEPEVLAVEEPSFVMVYVSGAVQEPGVYRVSADGRVNDALQAAGGFKGDAAKEAVNLARTVVDGEQIHFPTVDEAAQAPMQVDEAQPSSSAVSGLVNINTADAATLDTLPGVGPATAAKIIDYRENHGPFTSIEQIKQVSGIGDAKYAEMCSLICV